MFLQTYHLFVYHSSYLRYVPQYTQLGAVTMCRQLLNLKNQIKARYYLLETFINAIFHMKYKRKWDQLFPYFQLFNLCELLVSSNHWIGENTAAYKLRNYLNWLWEPMKKSLIRFNMHEADSIFTCMNKHY